MADSSTLSSLAASTGSRLPSIYHEAREVMFRAKTAPRADAPVVSRALNRLDTALSSGEPLDREVPRGFYLNILV
ncbi:MAG: hypothetical protein ISR44_06245 [Rhodospirillales bacterium]|nr:hypothetical protein [Alphaproteobacteria bacterium]MBL6928756.1 hypothetical protein [Rhodospirillales bacterium]